MNTDNNPNQIVEYVLDKINLWQHQIKTQEETIEILKETIKIQEKHITLLDKSKT